MDDRGRERMQRIRVGVTGLACVFLLVLLAAAFFGLTNNEQSTGRLVISNVTDPTGNGVAMAETPHEPLAELGVAPGFGGEPGNVVVNAPPMPTMLETPPAAPVLPAPQP